MLLREYMEVENRTSQDCADELDITVTQFNQYAYGKTVPRPDMMMEICVMTKGAVTADDFNGTTREKVEAEILRRKRNKQLQF